VRYSGFASSIGSGAALNSRVTVTHPSRFPLMSPTNQRSHFNSARATRYESPPHFWRLEIFKLGPAVLISTKVVFSCTFSLPFISHCMMGSSHHFEPNLAPRTPVNEVNHDAYLWGPIDQINLGVSF
jgi:hypothetical protein